MPVDPGWRGLRLDLPDGPLEVRDQEYLFLPVQSEATLLKEGVEHRLSESVRIRSGGRPVYVLYDEPRVDGRLQTQPQHRSSYHVLAHQSRVPDLLAAWRQLGQHIVTRPSHLPEWFWLENVPVAVDSPVLRLLGVGAALPPAVERPLLVGGLGLAGQQAFLTGGEPDLLLATAEPFELDDVQIEVEGGQRLVHLADLYPDPGIHRVATTHGDLRFRTISTVREQAVGGSVRRHYSRTSTPPFSEPDRGTDDEPALAGALLHRVPVPRRLVLRRHDAAECLVLTEAGELLEVQPRRPPWMVLAELAPAAVDVQHLVRSMSSPPAYVISRRPGRAGRAHKVGLEVPPGLEPTPGHAQSKPRPDLLPELVTETWTWIGTHDRRRLHGVLQTALKRRLSNSVSAGWTRAPHPQQATRELRKGPVSNNPYDDVLAWLSEQESARVSAQRFAAAWSWCCHRYGQAEAGSD